MKTTDTDPHPAGASRFVGKRVAFDHGEPPRRLSGLVESASYAGRTARGAIPDYTLAIRGNSGRVITASLVESRASFET